MFEKTKLRAYLRHLSLLSVFYEQFGDEIFSNSETSDIGPFQWSVNVKKKAENVRIEWMGK